MTTNVLLIIIIVLLALGLFVQLLQFLAIFGIPERLVDSFLDFFPEGAFDSEEATTVDVVEVASDEPEQPTKFKGFGKSKKSKGSKRRWSRQANKTSREAAETKVEITDVESKDK